MCCFACRGYWRRGIGYRISVDVYQVHGILQSSRERGRTGSCYCFIGYHQARRARNEGSIQSCSAFCFQPFGAIWRACVYGNKDYIISCSPLIHSGWKTKADLWVWSGSPLTRTILAKKCPSLSFPVQETGDFGLDARQKLQQCRVRMGQGGCLCYPPWQLEENLHLPWEHGYFPVNDF